MSGSFVASPDIARRYAQFSVRWVPQDARVALQQARTVSRLNDTSRGVGQWFLSLEMFTRSDRWRTYPQADSPRDVASRLFARHGATIEEIAQMTERGSRVFVLKLSHGKRAKKTLTTRTQEHAITGALALREEMNRRVSSPSDVEFVARATHRALHRALVGEDTRGCKWCEEDAR
jgi:hypothetical protein